MKIIIKIIAIVLLIIAVLLIALKIYNEGYERREEGKIRQAGAIEKQFKLKDDSIINYGEIKNDKPAILLIHGQEVSWEDYANVMNVLASKYNVFMVDCYGHGGSSKDIDKYNIVSQAEDIATFIEQVVKEPVIISGHSSGGLIATWIAAYEEDLVRGLVIEDSPFFTTEDGRAQNTFAWKGFEVMNNFLVRGEKNYMKYYLENNYMRNMFNKDGNDNWKMLVVDPVQKQIEKHPDKIPLQWYMPPFMPVNELYRMGANLQDGSGEYDLRFGQTFYNFKWFKNLNQKEMLKKVNCKSVLLHVAKAKEFKSYYDDKGILMSAMDERDAKLVDSLLADNIFIDNIEGSAHDIHRDRPDIFIDAVDRLAKELSE